MPHFCRVLPAVALLALTGCGGGSTLSGKVTYQGRPVVSGSVIVLNADGTAHSGVIHHDGSYAVEGVGRGPVRIGVLSPDPARAKSILKKEEPPPPADKPGAAKAGHPKTRPGTGGWVPLPHALGDPEKSGVTCDVNASHVEFDITLN